MTANQVTQVHKDIDVELDNFYAKSLNFFEWRFPDPSEAWIVPLGENRFHAQFDEFYACIASPDYEFSIPLMGITSQGELKICGKVSWFVDLETFHTKDVSCEHGCFPVDDLIEIKVVDTSINVIEAEVELGGGAFEWFLESLVALLMPIIKYITNEKCK